MSGHDQGLRIVSSSAHRVLCNRKIHDWTMNKRSPFRVTIVGGGPVGLYLTHAMEKAGIEYVLLERQSTILAISGPLLFTWPQTVRLFDQIEVARYVADSALAMEKKKRVYGEDFSITSTNTFWDSMRDK